MIVIRALFMSITMSRALSQDNIGLGSISSLDFSAPVAFIQSLQRELNEDDIQALIQSQKHMLSKFEKTNEMLINCNALLSLRHSGTSKELKKHIAFLVELKKDLEFVFRRIRFLKMKLSQQYPEAFLVVIISRSLWKCSNKEKYKYLVSRQVGSACNNKFNTLDEEEEQEEKDKTHLQAPDVNGTTNASSSYSQGSSPISVTSPSSSD